MLVCVVTVAGAVSTQHLREQHEGTNVMLVCPSNGFFMRKCGLSRQILGVLTVVDFGKSFVSIKSETKKQKPSGTSHSVWCKISSVAPKNSSKL
jgi:hypothetical protein